MSRVSRPAIEIASRLAHRIPTTWTSTLARPLAIAGVPVLASVLALIVYARTLALTITWRNNGADSGDLVAAAYTFGVPHPTGYPLYTLIAAVIAHLPIGEPARNVAWISAIAAAGAIVLIAYTARQFAAHWGTWIGVSVALTLGWSPLFWSQSVIAEVYAVNALLVAGLYAILFSTWANRLELAALVLGLGLAHHLSIVLLVPSVLVLVSDVKPTRAQIVRAGVCLIAPLLFYLYLPFRSATAPPIDWGDPHTLDGFWWMISGSAYRTYLFNLPVADISARLAATARLLFEQFNLWGVALGLWGGAQMALRPDARTRRRFIALVLGFVLVVLYALVYGSRDSYIYLLPAFMIFSLWIAFGVADLASYFHTQASALVLAFVLIFLPGYNLATNFAAMDLSQDRTALSFAESAFKTMPNEAIAVTDGDEHLFALEYYRQVYANSTRVTVISAELLRYDWYYDQARRMLSLSGLAVPGADERLKQMVVQAIARGIPVYATRPDDSYITQGDGVLFRIVSKHP